MIRHRSSRNHFSLQRLAIPLVLGAAFAAAPALAVAADLAPGTQLSNPSKAEPMMLEPSPAAEAAAYRRDVADCASHTREGRQICRQMVDEQYPESVRMSNAAQSCAALTGGERSECLAADGSMDRSSSP